MEIMKGTFNMVRNVAAYGKERSPREYPHDTEGMRVEHGKARRRLAV
jgi:hypothetical protein